MMVWRYFGPSILISLLALVAAFFISNGWEAVYITFVLGVLELSLSFDNAVVNAKILEHMDPVWQRRFIIFGIPIAVFGMRFLFPILLVYGSTSLSFTQVFTLALHDPEQYAKIVHAGYPEISAFGGSFLLMVFFHFLFNPNRKVYWLKWLEDNWVMRRLSKIAIVPAGCTMLVGVVFMHYQYSMTILVLYLIGIGIYLLLHIASALFMMKAVSGVTVMRYGIIGFLYLEILDASFSFDGVIGAFAISMNIFIIMLGLGIGALFVRSLTIFFVEKKALSRLRYLEHGAFYAIGCLAAVMLLKNFVHIPEWISGTVGIGFIIVALLSSWFLPAK